MEPEFELTIEPGIYINRLLESGKCFKDFIDYDKLESYREFTELRNEEDYLITEDGTRFWGTKVLLLQLSTYGCF